MEIAVRKPKKSEAKKIVAVLNSDVPIYRKAYSDRYIKFHGGIGTFAEGEIDYANGIVALVRGNIAGYADWRLKRNGIAWISMLIVAPRYYQRGVATKLFETIEKKAVRNGAKGIAGETQRRAVWVNRFNRKMGLKKVDWRGLNTRLFKGTLKQPPVKYTYVWGKPLV